MNHHDATPTPKPSAPDWEAIEADYRAGIKTLRQIGGAYGLSHVAVRKRAVRDGWGRGSHASASSTASFAATSEEMSRAGFLYVIYIEDSSGKRFCKIGMTSHFSARFGAHQCASPFDIRVACAYFVKDMRLEERLMHTMFSKKRVRGEWFELDDEDLKAITQRAKLV